jgi:hypothetical protein
MTKNLAVAGCRNSITSASIARLVDVPNELSDGRGRNVVEEFELNKCEQK